MNKFLSVLNCTRFKPRKRIQIVDDDDDNEGATSQKRFVPQKIIPMNVEPTIGNFINAEDPRIQEEFKNFLKGRQLLPQVASTSGIFDQQESQSITGSCINPEQTEVNRMLGETITVNDGSLSCSEDEADEQDRFFESAREFFPTPREIENDEIYPVSALKENVVYFVLGGKMCGETIW